MSEKTERDVRCYNCDKPLFLLTTADYSECEYCGARYNDADGVLKVEMEARDVRRVGIKDEIIDSTVEAMAKDIRHINKDQCATTKPIGKHYGYDYKGIRLDPYRIFSVYRISHPAQQHAIKKLLRAGESVKSLDDDIAEAIATLQRWQQMRAEDEA